MSDRETVLSTSEAQYLIIRSGLKTETLLSGASIKTIAKELHLRRHGDEAMQLCKDMSESAPKLVRCLFASIEDDGTGYLMKDPEMILSELDRRNQRGWHPATPTEVVRVFHSMDEEMCELLFEGRTVTGFQQKVERGRVFWLNGWVSHHLDKHQQPVTELTTTNWLEKPIMPHGRKSRALFIREVTRHI